MSVLPQRVSTSGGASTELRRKLVRSGQTDDCAARVCAQLSAEASRLAKQTLPTADAAVRVDRRVVLARVDAAASAGAAHSPLMTLTAAGVRVECSQAHLDKLRRLNALQDGLEQEGGEGGGVGLSGKQGGPRKRKRQAQAGPAERRPEGGDGGAEEGPFLARAFCVLARLLALQGKWDGTSYGTDGPLPLFFNSQIAK